MTKKLMTTLFTLFMISIIGANSVKANDLSFSVTPVIPANQADGVYSYFDLHVEPNTTEHLQIKVVNLSDQSATIAITPTNALTNKNGGIYYTKQTTSENAYLLDDSFAMATRIHVQNEVSLQPKETKVIPFKVETPAAEKGVFLGGLLFEKKEVDKRETVQKEGEATFQLLNKSALAMGVQLRMPEEVAGQFVYGETNVEFTPSGVLLNMEFQNKSATLMEAEEIAYKLLDKKKKPVFDGVLTHVKIAPMNALKYPWFWEGAIASGAYDIQLKAKIDGQVIEHISSFYVEKEKVKDHIDSLDEKASQFLVKEQVPLWMWGVFIVLGALIIFLFLKVRKNKKHNENE